MTLGRILQLGCIEQGNDFFDRPNMVRDTSFHRRCYPQGLVNAAEIIMHKVERDSVRMILGSDSVPQNESLPSQRPSRAGPFPTGRWSRFGPGVISAQVRPPSVVASNVLHPTAVELQ